MHTAGSGDATFATKEKFKSSLPKPKSFLPCKLPTSISKEKINAVLQQKENEKELSYENWKSKVGCRVSLAGVKHGTLMFFGKTAFAEGEWCGIQLDEPVGKNSGVIDGITYFTCPNNHGIFAPPSKVQFVDSPTEKRATQNEISKTKEILPALNKKTLHFLPSSAASNKNECFAGDEMHVPNNELDRTVILSDKPNIQSKLQAPKILRKPTGIPLLNSKQSNNNNETNFGVTKSKVNGKLSACEDKPAMRTNEINLRSKLTCSSSLDRTFTKESKSETSLGISFTKPVYENCKNKETEESCRANETSSLNNTFICSRNGTFVLNSSSEDYQAKKTVDYSTVNNGTFVLNSSSEDYEVKKSDDSTARNGTFVLNTSSEDYHENIVDNSTVRNGTFIIDPSSEDDQAKRILDDSAASELNSSSTGLFDNEFNKDIEMCENINTEAAGESFRKTEGKSVMSTNIDDIDVSVNLQDVIQEDYDSEEMDGFGRQGSFELDESLGILTPNQIKDFTLFTENSLMKTPSVEDVQELNDETIDDFVQEMSVKKEYEDYDLFAKNELCLKESFLAKTSTPFRGNDHISLCRNIGDLTYPEVDENLSYFHLNQFYTPKLSGNETFNLHNLSNITSNSNESTLSDQSVIGPGHLNKDNTLMINENQLTFDKSSDKTFSFAMLCDDELTSKMQETKDLCAKTGKNQDGNLSAINELSVNKTFLVNRMSPFVDYAEKLSHGVVKESIKELVSSCFIPEKLIAKPSPQLSEISGGREEVMTEYLMHQITPNLNENLLEKKDRPFSSLTVSVTSIDTGYQGDAEGDVPSATASALNTPVEEQRKFGASENLSTLLNDAVCVLRHPKVDVGSDSDFCSDMGTSWTESEVELEEKARGRSARVIDGKLYYSTDEMEQLTIDVEKESIGEIMSFDDVAALNSGKISKDINKETPPVSKVEDDTETVDETVTVIENDVSSGSSATVENGLSRSQNDTCVVPSVKDVPSEDFKLGADEHNDSHSSNKENIEIVPSESPRENKNKTPDKPSQNNENGMPHQPVASDAKRSVKKEENVGLKKFKTPKKNVVSKIKAMIESSAKSPQSPEEKKDLPKKTRTPKKSRWDAVMSKIAAGQAEEKAKSKTKKEIKSRVDTNLSGSKTKSPLERRFPLKSANFNNTFAREHTGLSEGHGEENSMHSSNRSSRSDLSFSQPSNSRTQSKSKVPRRPSSHKIERPGSPSQLSDASTLSATSHLSAYSHHSQMSCGALNKSNASLNSTASNVINAVPKSKDTSNNRPKPAAANAKQTKKIHVPARLNLASSVQTQNEQVRLRNVKNQPTVSKSNLQTDANNSSSVARTNFSKERARLESICEKHLKEKHLMKTYIDQKNREMEALALVLRYMNEELNAFSLPSLRLQLKRLNAELEEVKNHLEQASKENNDLETRLTNLTSAHCEEINKLKECHAAELDQLKESLQKSSLEEITQLKETHQAAEEERRRNFEHQLEDLNSQHEKHKSEMESLHKSKVLELEEKHKLEVEGLEKSFADEVAEINKQSKLLQSELQEKISKLKLKQEELKQQNKEMEENMMKDSDFKIQMAAAKIKDLEKEVDSLKTVMELRNKEVHDLRQESNQLKKLKEELHVAEEKIAVLSARTEDLQAQVNIKSTSERRLTLEHQLLKEWYDKESKVNKRLSMEKEELQWRLQQNTSPDYHSWDESMNKRYDVDTSASRKYYYESSAASSPRVMSKSNPVQIRDPHNRRHQRLSVSDIENKGKNEMSPAVRYRRAGSLSWTVGIDPKEMIDSPTNDETNVKDPIMPESNENRHQTFLLVDDLNDSCESSELKSGDESDTSSVFKSSDIFQLSDLHLSETEQSVKQDASCSSSCNQGSESKSSENCSQEEKTKLSESHRKEKHSTSTPSHSCEDTRLPSLITIKTLEDSHNSSSHYKLSETPSKLRHKNGKSANKTPLPTEISQKTEVRQHCGNTVQELGHSSKQSELDLGEAARKSFEKLNENVVENEFVCKVIPVFTVADANQPSSPKFTSFPEEHSQDSNIDGFDLVCTDTDNNRVHVNDDEQLASLETSSSLPHCCSTDELVSGCFQNVLHDEKNDLNPVALHTRSSMVDAIELDYSARCLTNLEESQHSSITDSNVMEETISESHNSSDYEIVSETEDTTNIRLTSPKWDSAPMSFSDMDHSPVHSRRSEGSGGLLNTTTVLGMKSPTDSSPLQEPLEMLNSSRSSSSSSSSSSEESSPRNSSPLFKIRDAGRESLEDSPCSFAMSPRMSAGEAMVGLPSPHHHDQTRESSNTLLRRTLHEQFIHDKATLNCVDSGGKDSSSEEISQAYFSKPATPESMSQAVAPTDSTNIDLSWSDDDDDGIPSESEV